MQKIQGHLDDLIIRTNYGRFYDFKLKLIGDASLSKRDFKRVT